jgi:hypothetical protein
MPQIYKENYGIKTLPDGTRVRIVPTTQRFVEQDGSDVRLDRVYVLDENGKSVRSYLQDKMGQRFIDNLTDIKDDLSYLEGLPTKERKN